MSKVSRREFVKTTALAPLAAAPFSLSAQALQEDRFDIVVAGAGPNTHTAGGLLGHAGRRLFLREGGPMRGRWGQNAGMGLEGVKDDAFSTARALHLDN